MSSNMLLIYADHAPPTAPPTAPFDCPSQRRLNAGSALRLGRLDDGIFPSAILRGSAMHIRLRIFNFILLTSILHILPLLAIFAL
jgi:hypothetical protein